MGVTAAVGILTGAQINEQKKAAKAQKRAGEVQTASEKVRDMAMKRQQIRESRIRRAQILQTAENVGTAGSSGVGGATSAVESQTQSKRAFMQGQAVASEGVSNLMQSAASHQLNAQIWGQLANLSVAALPAPKPVGGVKGQNTAAQPITVS